MQGTHPYKSESDGWYIWDIPVSTRWWRSLDPSEVSSLCQYPHEGRDGKSYFAAMVAAAIEEVEHWQIHGLDVDGLRWLDIGGADGYYAIALKLCGAKCVILVDERTPSAWALPVLDKVGVEVVKEDGNLFSSDDAEACLLLHNPEVEFGAVLSNNPALRLVLNDGCETTPDVERVTRDWLSEIGWKRDSLITPLSFLGLTEDGAFVNYPERNEPKKIVYSGPPIPRPVPPMPDEDDYYGALL